jgi:hypothetical protein
MINVMHVPKLNKINALLATLFSMGVAFGSIMRINAISYFANLKSVIMNIFIITICKKEKRIIRRIHAIAICKNKKIIMNFFTIIVCINIFIFRNPTINSQNRKKKS